MRNQAERKHFRRALGRWDLVCISLGTMIGGGIFTTIGSGVKLAGPAIIVAFALAGFASFFAALSFAELGAMVPVSGSAYTYAYATLGEVVAWIIGWDLILEYGIGAAPVAQQFSAALQDALQRFGLILPVWARTAHYATHQVDLLGALFIIVLSILLALGIRETALSNNLFVVLKISALGVFIVAAFSLFRFEHFRSFAPYGWGHLSLGASGTGIIPAAALVFFSFIGFDAATTTAEESVNPQRDIPFGVLGSLGIGAIIYCTTAIALIGAVPWQKVSQSRPLADAVATLHNPFVDWMITLGVLVGTASVALISLLGQSRIFYAMARDGLLPRSVAALSPTSQTPVRTTLIMGTIVAFCTLIVPLDMLLELVNIGTFSAFIIVCAGVLWLRHYRPELDRPFRSPCVPLFPLCGIALSVFLSTVGLGPFTWLRFLAWLLVGLAVYLSYGYRNSYLAMGVLPAGEK